MNTVQHTTDREARTHASVEASLRRTARDLDGLVAKLNDTDTQSVESVFLVERIEAIRTLAKATEQRINRARYGRKSA
ncbi:hypothetical protein [Shimia sp.]|uniref:hypothetical protein n=1 Tax=Shimia sp. TaxID=1954381 RepID=UPI0032970F5E